MEQQRGFTLIEIMIALVIIAIIAGVALPTYQSQEVKSRRADCQDGAQLIAWTFDTLSDRDDVRVAILTGEGKVFCAGADIKERVGAEPQEVLRNLLDRVQVRSFRLEEPHIEDIYLQKVGAPAHVEDRTEES